ncbi:DUF1828 domain-containing protein [Lactobacillus kullabergensis]|uniref:DUF1828 domain-containing protein n=2 Tax=Lactobacillus TaxID=1578 RepID=A0ABM6W076_9LACO|nr:DUF1828 domain-containing protein [Lactobacillus kullabergensis]AWM75232.1 hypothetical protein DKL58_04290 [Lactobacillus kullabergensis]
MAKIKNEQVSINLQKELAEWVATNTHILNFDPDTFEIETIFKDSFGESVYCFVEKIEFDKYKVTDDGRTLFKLDPSASDEDLIAASEDLITASGFSFNVENGVISCECNEQTLAENIMQLGQLEVNVSYLN